MREPFDKLCEAFYSNFTAGCFYPGNIVAFEDTIKDLECYSTLAPDVKVRLDNMIEQQKNGEAVIVVAGVDVNPLMYRNYAPATLTLAYSHSGGRWVEPISLPGSIGEGLRVVDTYAAPGNSIPSKARIDYREYSEPKEVDLKDLEKNRFNPTVKGVIDITTMS